MSVWLPWQSQSSVISAGFKPSLETHIALMVHGQQQKGLVAFYNMCYLCTMGVLSSCLAVGVVVVVEGGGAIVAIRTEQRRKLRKTFLNCSERRMVLWKNHRFCQTLWENAAWKQDVSRKTTTITEVKSSHLWTADRIWDKQTITKAAQVLLLYLVSDIFRYNNLDVIRRFSSTVIMLLCDSSKCGKWKCFFLSSKKYGSLCRLFKV